MFWEAWQDLQTERRNPRGTIPVSSILRYCEHYGLEADTVKRFVWAIDRVVLSYWASQDEAAKKQAETQSEPPTIGRPG